LRDAASANARQCPAILPWFLYIEWRPSFRWYGPLYPFTPSRRIAAGHAARTSKIRALIRNMIDRIM